LPDRRQGRSRKRKNPEKEKIPKKKKSRKRRNRKEETVKKKTKNRMTDRFNHYSAGHPFFYFDIN